MRMKVCVCILDDTLSQNAKDGGCRSIAGFRKRRKKFEKNKKIIIIFFTQRMMAG